MEFLGLTADQLLILAAIGVVLVVVLVVLKVVLKLTKDCLSMGCLGILVILAIAFFLLRAVAEWEATFPKAASFREGSHSRSPAVGTSVGDCERR